MEPPPTQHPMQRLYGGVTVSATTTDNTATQPDNDQTNGAELRAVDCNLASLCEHVRAEGFNNGSFSDVVVTAMGSTYNLHRLILSRSSYFRNMLQGPWKEANASIVDLHVDDKNVNGEAIAMALAYLYGHHPKLNDDNAFRVLAAASFLDLQDLCAICTDFIISELWTTNFLAYQVFAESQDYGIHGERVKNACWGYLCQSGAMELKEVLPKLSFQTLHALLTSDKLWIPSEEKRFELALFTFLAKTALCKGELLEESSSAEIRSNNHSDSTLMNAKSLMESGPSDKLESKLRCLSLKDDHESFNTAQDSMVLVPKMQQVSFTDSNLEPICYSNNEQVSLQNSGPYIGNSKSSCSDMPTRMEGPSEEWPCYQLNNNSWLGSDQRHSNVMDSSDNGYIPGEWGRGTTPPLSWGGRIVGRRQIKSYARDTGVNGEEYETFVSIFEGGSVLYSNMSFEAILTVRKHLEELGFPCKAINDSLWLQMLLSQRVQEVGADTCKNCCLVSLACACKQQFVHGVSAPGYYVQEHRHVHQSGNMGHAYVTDGTQGEGNGIFRPVRVHVRGTNEGLAGIGRGPTNVPATAWPPTRFVFSRVPINMSTRNGQQSIGNDDSEIRGERNVDSAGDGLTALVGLSHGMSEQTDTGCESDTHSRLAGPSVSGPGISVQMLESVDQNLGIEWENANSSISLDMQTPLNHFPPFRFGVEFQDVHRVNDNQVKHSPEVYYAGSLWKVSVQAFCDEDPQGRRTLGLFLHRRKAEIPETLRKVHMFVDTREKVTARYQLICPSKREVMVFGSFKQTGTLLPKAPKGWGWRTALLFDELGDLLQNGALRIAAVVQLV